MHKGLELKAIELVKQLGMALIDQMQLDAQGHITGFGIEGFGEADFARLIDECIAGEAYEAAGYMAITAYNKHWCGVNDDMIIRDILTPYFNHAAHRLGVEIDNIRSYKGTMATIIVNDYAIRFHEYKTQLYEETRYTTSIELKEDGQETGQEYGKALNLIAFAMESIQKIDKSYIEGLFKTTEEVLHHGDLTRYALYAVASPKETAYYRPLILVPLIKLRTAEVNQYILGEWVDDLMAKGQGLQAGIIAAAGVEAGLVDKQHYEGWMTKFREGFGDKKLGQVPLLCAGIRNRRMGVTEEQVKTLRGSIIDIEAGFVPDEAIIAQVALVGLEENMAFTHEDVVEWMDRYVTDRRARKVGVRIAKAALNRGILLPAEGIAKFGDAYVAAANTPVPVAKFFDTPVAANTPALAVDVALVARNAGIDVGDAKIQEWQEACCQGETPEKAVDNIIALIDVYRSQPAYQLDPRMNDKVNQAFEAVMAQRDALGLTDATPLVQAVQVIRQQVVDKLPEWGGVG